MRTLTNRQKAQKIARQVSSGNIRELERLADLAEKMGVPFVTKDGIELRTKQDIVNHILHLLG